NSLFNFQGSSCLKNLPFFRRLISIPQFFGFVKPFLKKSFCGEQKQKSPKNLEIPRFFGLLICFGLKYLCKTNKTQGKRSMKL
ncbi:MAG: hypothetical protein J6B54_02045, partial [Clostridia bacterium]|nr:hypothetical protein [Clostridia bacterium]